MSSINQDTALITQVGDGALAGALSVTGTAAVFTFPATLRGKRVRLIPSTGTAYLSGGHKIAAAGSAEVAPTTATVANGLPVASATDIFIPMGSGPYKVSIIGSGVLSLKYIAVSA